MSAIASITNQLKKIDLDANELDRDWQALSGALKILGSFGLLALKVPENFGGKGLTPFDYGEWQIEIARLSGALGFLQTQHQSAGSLLAKSPNQALQQTYLPQMATGEKLLGVGFSQLRRLGKPLVVAMPVTGGYELSGLVPWVTGGGIFSEFIVGATLPDGRELYGVVPLQTQVGIAVSKAMDLVAMTATNTVSVSLTNWFVPEALVLDLQPPQQIQINSRQNVLSHSWFSLGCAYTALDWMDTVYEKKSIKQIYLSKTNLENRVKKCHLDIKNALSSNNSSYQEKLDLRAKAIELSFLCSQSAVIATSGAANFVENDAGRIYREALVFSVSGQTSDILETSLKNGLCCKDLREK